MNNRLVYEIKLDQSSGARLLGYSVLLTFVAIIVYGTATDNYQIGPESLIISIAIYILAIMLHEFMHGFFFRLFGGKPKYGVGFSSLIPIAYATSPGTQYTFLQMLTIGLSPFIIISIFSLLISVLVPLTALYLSIVFMGNFVGAIGDIWMSSKMWKFRKCTNTYFIDLKDGLGVISSDKHAINIAKKLKKSSDPDQIKNIFINRWVATSFTIFILITLAPFLMSVFQVEGDILIGWQNFPILDYSSDSNVTGFTINFWLPTIIGFLIACLLFTRDKLAYKSSN